MSKPLYEVYTKDFANMMCRKLERKNKKLHKIIKEAREYIEEHTLKGDGMLIGVMDNYTKKELLEILDKENE